MSSRQLRSIPQRLSSRLALAAVAAAIVGVAAPQTALARAPAAACAKTAQAVVPFEQATVEAQADGKALVSWRAPAGAGKVAVFASTSPDGSSGIRVGEGGASGSLAVAPPKAAPRWYYQLRPACGTPLVVAARRIGLQGAPNFRDVGGYRTTDGRWVRMGVLYRSDELSKLSDKDVAVVEALGVEQFADLRTDPERQRQPNRFPPQAKPAIYDVAGQAQIKGVAQDSFTEIAAKGGLDQVLVQANRSFVASPGAAAGFGKLLDQFAAAERPMLFHCTAGKDRTGWAAAALLLALGVPRETVMQDYLLSAEYLAPKNKVMIEQMRRYPQFANTPPEQLEALLTVRPSYIQAGFDEVEKRYGSFDRYLHEGLGLTDADIAALKTKLLVGAPNTLGS